MKLNTAFEAALSTGEGAHDDIMQYVASLRTSHRPSAYRCTEPASRAIAAFLGELCLADRVEFTPSALDPSTVTMTWKDPRDATILAETVSESLGNLSALSAYMADNPFPPEPEGPVVAAPSPDQGPSTLTAPAPVDLVAARLRVVDFFRTNPTSEGFPPIGLLMNRETPVIPSARIVEEYARLTDPAFVAKYPARVFSPEPEGEFNRSFRRVRLDESIVPATGFFMAAAHRTLCHWSDGDEQPAIDGYVGHTVADAGDMPTENRPVTAVFGTGALAMDLDALEFCSDRPRLFAFLRDAYSALFGEGYDVVVDLRTRVAVDNHVVRGRLPRNRDSVLDYYPSDHGSTDIRPYSVQFILYVVPKGLAGTGHVEREAKPASTGIVLVKEASSRSDVFDSRYITTAELPAEWFAMTHLETITGEREQPDSYHGHYDPRRTDEYTAKAKTTLALLRDMTPLAVANRCTVSTAAAFRVGAPEPYGPQIPDGPAPAAFVNGIGGVLRMAWCEATGDRTDPVLARPDAKEGTPHDPKVLVTAVYSGISTDKSPTIPEWNANTSLPFPRMRDRDGNNVMDKGEWTKFIDALPGTKAMMEMAQRTSGTPRTHHVIVETNIPYGRFMEKVANATGPHGLPWLRRTLVDTAVATLAYRSRNPGAGLAVQDNSESRFAFTDVGHRMRWVVETELSNRGTAKGMLGQLFNLSTADRAPTWSSPTGPAQAWFREDSYGRLYVIVSIDGAYGFYMHMAYRMISSVHVSSAGFVRECTPDTVLPEGAVFAPDSRRKDPAVLAAYAVKALLSPVGGARDWSNTGRDLQFWQPLYRYPFNESGNDAYDDDDEVPAREWFRRTAERFPEYGSTLVSDMIS